MDHLYPSFLAGTRSSGFLVLWCEPPECLSIHFVLGATTSRASYSAFQKPFVAPLVLAFETFDFSLLKIRRNDSDSPLELRSTARALNVNGYDLFSHLSTSLFLRA